MQEPLENGEDQLNDLRIENEIKKIKLSLEHGGNFSAMSNIGLPPEIEGKWLDYIQQFEDEFAKRKTISVYDFVGQPDFIPVNDIPDAAIKDELDRIIVELNEHSVLIDTICEVDDRELYRFITEELFAEETNDMHIEGMRTCFIYEEFHPNHEHDIKNRCREFIEQVLDKDDDWTPKFLSLTEEITSGDILMTDQQAIKKLEAFRDSFSSFALDHFDFTSIILSPAKDAANVACEMSYLATLEGSIETMEFSGLGSFELQLSNDWWAISEVHLPGFPL